VVAFTKEETLFMNVIFCFVCVCVCGILWDRGGAMKEDRKNNNERIIHNREERQQCVFN
jgi:hypothetical protein